MSTNPDAAQAYLNMHLASAIGKGVQLDAVQTAAIFALITDQRHEIEELRDRLRELRGERAAVVDMLRACADAAGDASLVATNFRFAANIIERGEHRREEER